MLVNHKLHTKETIKKLLKQKVSLSDSLVDVDNTDIVVIELIPHEGDI